MLTVCSSELYIWIKNKLYLIFAVPSVTHFTTLLGCKSFNLSSHFFLLKIFLFRMSPKLWIHSICILIISELCTFRPSLVDLRWQIVRRCIIMQRKNKVFGGECKKINEPQLNCEQCHDPHWFTRERQTKHLFNRGVLVSPNRSRLRVFFFYFQRCQYSGQYLAVVFSLVLSIFSPTAVLLVEFWAKHGLKHFAWR